jgi:ADP-ribosyl-[dinitrogen reductase] hydrolase
MNAPTPASVPMKDRFVGCLLGGAVGDALGAPYEGLWSHTIPNAEVLLNGFAEFEGYPTGQFTDDTQLTVATVRSILATGSISPQHIARSISKLFARQEVIGPGGACMSAAQAFLKTRDWTTCGAELGQAGNGTAMRTAVLGLAFLDCPDRLPGEVADVSRITHQDPRSIAGGIAVARMAQLFASRPESDPVSFCPEVAEDVARFSPPFATWIRRLSELVHEPVEIAFNRIAWAGMEKPEFERPIITPFIIPTVLASFWCLFRDPDSWSQSVATVIQLGGDVDTLGAIVGALAGVRLGAEAIPKRLRQSVQRARPLEDMALKYHELMTRDRTH